MIRFVVVQMVGLELRNGDMGKGEKGFGGGCG